MEKSEETKIIYFQSASVKKDLSNLPQELEYLLIDNLLLDDVLNLPIGLKEIHITEWYDFDDNKTYYCRLRKITKDRFFKLPFECKFFKLKTYNYTSIINSIKQNIVITYISNCKVSKSDITTLKLYSGFLTFDDNKSEISEYKGKINVKYGKSGLKQIRFSN